MPSKKVTPAQPADYVTKVEFNQAMTKIDQRFEKIDQRFEKIDQRFEKIDQRFEKIDQRFEKIDQRFEKIDQRFEKIDQHFEIIDQSIKNIHQSMGTMQDDIQGIGIQYEDISSKMDLLLEVCQPLMPRVADHEERITKLEQSPLLPIKN